MWIYHQHIHIIIDYITNIYRTLTKKWISLCT
jgi:hypothetical protein